MNSNIRHLFYQKEVANNPVCQGASASPWYLPFPLKTSTRVMQVQDISAKQAVASRSAFTLWIVLLICANPLLFLHAANPQIVAHRGASHDAPENTLPSVLLAWKQGADASEVDIHLSKDNQIVVIHDKTTKKTAHQNLEVSAVDYDQLRKLDVGEWKSAVFRGTRIPLLKEVLASVPDQKRIFIEIKCASSVIPYLEKVVTESGLSSWQTVFIAFDWQTIRLAKQRFPDCDCFWLSGFKKNPVTGTWNPSPDALIKRALEAGVDGLDVFHGGPVDKDFVRAASAKGLEVYVYTVDDPEAARRLLRAGVHGVTTDRPAFIRAQLGLKP